MFSIIKKTKPKLMIKAILLIEKLPLDRKKNTHTHVIAKPIYSTLRSESKNFCYLTCAYIVFIRYIIIKYYIIIKRICRTDIKQFLFLLFPFIVASFKLYFNIIFSKVYPFLYNECIFTFDFQIAVIHSFSSTI